MGADRSASSVRSRARVSPGLRQPTVFVGITWMARTGAQWRHLPDEYGKWNSAFRRYRGWVETGVFDAIQEQQAQAHPMYYRTKYKWRNQNWRRVANRYDKTKDSHLGFVAIAAVK